MIQSQHSKQPSEIALQTIPECPDCHVRCSVCYSRSMCCLKTLEEEETLYRDN